MPSADGLGGGVGTEWHTEGGIGEVEARRDHWGARRSDREVGVVDVEYHAGSGIGVDKRAPEHPMVLLASSGELGASSCVEHDWLLARLDELFDEHAGL